MAHNFCASCGAPIKPGAHFCAACGAPVGDDSNAAAPQAPEAPQSFPAPEAPQASETRAIPSRLRHRTPDASATVAGGAAPAPQPTRPKTPRHSSVAPPPSAETVAMPQAAHCPPASGFAAPGEMGSMQPVAGQATGPQPRCLFFRSLSGRASHGRAEEGLIAGTVAAAIVATSCRWPCS